MAVNALTMSPAVVFPASTMLGALLLRKKRDGSEQEVKPPLRICQINDIHITVFKERLKDILTLDIFLETVFNPSINEVSLET